MNEGRLLVIYSTVDGQSALVAHRLAEAATADSKMWADVRDVREVKPRDLDSYGSVIIVASVRYGHHSKRVTKFVTENRERIASKHTAFVSVSGAAQDPARRAEAESYVTQFEQVTGWTPDQTMLAGGAIKFTKYNFFVKFMTKRALKANGVVMDTTRDYDFTNWSAVAEFGRTFSHDGDAN